MIKSITFENFKVLRKTTLPLGPFTLIVGPNGSGKSTAIEALKRLARRDPSDFLAQYEVTLSAGLPHGSVIMLRCEWDEPYKSITTRVQWTHDSCERTHQPPQPAIKSEALEKILGGIRTYSFDAQSIASPVQLQPYVELSFRGDNLAGVLDDLRDANPERFEALNAELGRWIPEFDRVLFQTPQAGQRSFALRTRTGQHLIPAHAISQGTLLALAMLTLAYLPKPPALVCLEDPDRGLHPRLLRDVKDALYRLSFPKDFGEKRSPVQVLATTHSPLFLNLFRENLEEVVLANKHGLEGSFERLSDRPDVDEILKGADLGEVWYTGILGGVPTPAQG